MVLFLLFSKFPFPDDTLLLSDHHSSFLTDIFQGNLCKVSLWASSMRVQNCPTHDFFVLVFLEKLAALGKRHTS